MTDRQQSLLQAAAVIYSHGNCTADSAVAVALDLEAPHRHHRVMRPDRGRPDLARLRHERVGRALAASGHGGAAAPGG